MSRQTKGFTLLEIMLVVVLLSLTAAFVLPTLPNVSNDETRTEAEQFFQLIQVWNEQSLLSGQMYGVRVESDKYQLVELTVNNANKSVWQQVTHRRLKTQVNLARDVEVRYDSFDQDSNSLFDNNDPLFDDEPFYDDMFPEDEDQQTLTPPQILMFGNGEMLPFVLTFDFLGQAQWQVKGNDVAQIEIIALNED